MVHVARFHENHSLDRVAISIKSHRLLTRLLDENPDLERLLRGSRNDTEALVGVQRWVLDKLGDRPAALAYQKGEARGREAFEKLQWSDYAAIRLLDYIDHADRRIEDLNLRGEVAVSNPIRTIWLAVHFGTGGGKPPFFTDMLHLFRQLRGEGKPRAPTLSDIDKWMSRWKSGIDPRIIRLREENRDRIISVLIDEIDSGRIKDRTYRFDPGLSKRKKREMMLEWWNQQRFHLRFAVRCPDLLNELLGRSLDPDTMKVLYEARDAGIPFFVNPYYLSLLYVRVPYFAIGADLAIRCYVLYSRQLVEEFGHIVAWEREDEVRPGEPNAAGWLLPSEHNVHRRYPDVAILIPDTTGRACGGLCASCQRMYDFQRGNLNFDLDALAPKETWSEKLERLLSYWEHDSQLKDILITGGDALMSTDAALSQILDAVVVMAERKREANGARADGDKYAEIQRVRLGTRLPAYLPQRITPELVEVLREFKDKAQRAGIKQLVIQTHFQSPMEITPESREAVRRLLSAGWMVSNQLVFTAAASRRGHTAKLRKVLCEIGVLPYYTFSVKGYMENYEPFATNARAVQEQIEEKVFGLVPENLQSELQELLSETERMPENVAALRSKAGLPFLATDRNVLNLPGVGKSLTFRVIGITRYGRRILEFDHDATRRHSPIIEKTGKVVIIESKSISEYLEQLDKMGEEPSEYEGLYGYSLGETEPQMPLYEYPPSAFPITSQMTNFCFADEKSSEPTSEAHTKVTT